MFKEFFESKPKGFYVALKHNRSKKWQVVSKPSDDYLSSAFIDIDEKTSTITVDQAAMIYVSGFGIEWDSSWDWGDFGSLSGKKIEQMIKYLKENNV